MRGDGASLPGRGDGVGSPHQGEVRQGLRCVADLPPGDGVVLLAHQPDVVRETAEPVHE